VARNEHELMAAGSRLSDRLRSLREEVPGLTQKDLAQVFEGNVSMVSMWETGRRLPPEPRLRTYARLFATRQSFTAGPRPRLVGDEELTGEELRRLRDLEEELFGLRREATVTGDGTAAEPSMPPHVFRLTGGAPITIVCADVPEDKRPRYARRTDLNYVRASSFADLDALLDLFGHLRAENPDERVRIRASAELKVEEMSGHLILLGGTVWNEATRLLSEQIDLPLGLESVDGEEILVLRHGKEPRQFRVRLEDGVLREDIGVFVRVPNPQAPQCTVTICIGITTRGVRGVVQCFADYDLRDRNEEYMATRFGDEDTYGIVIRVRVSTMSGEPLPPDLTKPHTRLDEWTNGEAGPEQGSDG
jgi:transcriptional regulator with XRE-family HTH domain